MQIPLKSRRELLLEVLPACSLCFGFSRLASGNASIQATQSLSLEKRASERTEMSYADLFSFSYDRIIAVFANLCDQIGKDKFIEMLKQASYERAFRSMESVAKNVPESARDMATYLSVFRNPSPIYQHALTYEILKDSEKEAELRVTECLWAKTFRRFNAADIGYAFVCIDDEATIKAYNPKIDLKRPKLLMRGDNECRYLFRMES